MSSENVLIGQRVFLRPLRLIDVNSRYVSWLNDPQVNQYLESRFQRWTLSSAKAYIKSMISQPNIYFWGIFLHKNHRHIGNLKLGPINQHHHFAEIGLMIGDRSCWGKGFAQESLALVIEFAFHHLNLHKLTAGAYNENIGSIKAFTKCGFVIEGKKVEHYFVGEKFQNAVNFGLINKNFR